MEFWKPAGILGGQGDLLGDVAGGDELFRPGDVIVLHHHHLEPGAHLGIVLDELAQAQKRADKLGDHGSQRGSPDIKMKSADQDQIQENVDDGRNNEIDQRMTAVSYRLKDPDKKVIHHKCQRSGKIDSEICNGAGQNFGRGSHQYQNLGCGKDTDEGQDQTADQTEGGGSMD